MVNRAIKDPANVVERNLALTAEVTHYLLRLPHVLDSLPEKFELVILPDDDPEIRLYNLELLDRYGSEGKSVVFARMTSHDAHTFKKPHLDFYAPIAA